MPPRFEVIGVAGLPEIARGDDLARLTVDAARAQGTPLLAASFGRFTVVLRGTGAGTTPEDLRARYSELAVALTLPAVEVSAPELFTSAEALPPAVSGMPLPPIATPAGGWKEPNPGCGTRSSGTSRSGSTRERSRPRPRWSGRVGPESRPSRRPG